MKPFLQLVLACPGLRYEAYLIIMKEKGFFSLLLAFSLPRGEGSLTYGVSKPGAKDWISPMIRSVGNHSLLFLWCC